MFLIQIKNIFVQNNSFPLIFLFCYQFFLLQDICFKACVRYFLKTHYTSDLITYIELQ